eukprot:Hpha_TRINITY_DN262_c0_g1::TRINITY_DN262_c0_g1_i2::g.83745::m.83745
MAFAQGAFAGKDAGLLDVEVLAGTFQVDVVGRRYYNTPTPAAGSGVVLEREPSNIHDPHAVKVSHGGAQLGHLPRTAAGPLATLLDAKTVSVTAVVCGVFPPRGGGAEKDTVSLLVYMNSLFRHVARNGLHNHLRSQFNGVNMRIVDMPTAGGVSQ